MTNVWRIIKVVLVTIYFSGLLLAVNYDTYLATRLGQPLVPVMMQVVLCVSVVVLILAHVRLLFKSKRLHDDFITIVNHSFRTILTRILWTSNTLKETQSHTEKEELVQDIQNAAERLLAIVDTFLGIVDVRDVSSYAFKAVSIHEIVETSLLKHSAIINQKNIQMDVSLFNKMPLLTADLKKISFVIDVLIENALTYTPRGGHIVIDCKNEGQKITFMVNDSGIGLNGSEGLKVFNKFYRSKRAEAMNSYGLGLGLYLSKIIVARHGGRIYAESAGVNQGSTFFVELPL